MSSLINARLLLIAMGLAACTGTPEAPELGQTQQASAIIGVKRITWNVIGLDSNDVTVGPATFPVGVRITNTGDATATNLTATFSFTTANALVNLASPATTTIASLAPGASYDAYYDVAITRNAAARGTKRGYVVTVAGTGFATATTPSPREIFVESLVSQNRNLINSITGPTAVNVGDTATYVLDGRTATNGYEQLVAELTFRTAGFQVLSTAVTYSVPVGATNTTLYADACGWDNVPTSPTYRSCIGPVGYAGGKAGGSVITTYTVKAVGAGTFHIDGMIYDFSGSSYHYNSDFGLAGYTVVSNAPPVASNDSYTTLEDTTLTVAAPGVLANDVDPEGAPLTVSLIAAPAHGTLTLAANGSFTYVPAANYNGPDSFSYVANDGKASSNVATVSLTVTAVNDPPTATADFAGVAPNTAATAINVLANDSSAPDTGETLTIIAVTQPANGTVVITGGGTGLTFQPAANFSGTTSFSYTISDGNGGTASATVTVTVSAGNLPPVANADTATVAEDAAATAIPVLANDTTQAGETLTITAVTQPSAGTVVITGGGTGLTFQPAANFNGTTSFSYTISDGNGGFASATVTMTVTPVNDPPTANPDTATVAEDSGATVIAVLANDTAAPDTGETLTVIAVTQPTGGTVVITGGGTGVSFQPAANFNGTATFSYTISDGNGGTASATVTVTVTPVNDPPTANADTATVARNAGPTVIDVLANDTIAPDTGETLTIVAATQPANGTVVITGGGTGLTFQPAVNYIGTTTFSYTISDGNGGTASALVTVNVAGTNLPPVANADAATVAEDSAATAIPVLANDTTEPGETLTITAVTQPTGGTVVITGGGTGVSFQPAANFNGTATFSYTISDGNGGTASATVTVTVTPVNDPPTATADAATVARNAGPTAIGVLANDSFAPDTGETLTITAVTQPANGTVVITGGGSGLTFQPAASFTGTTSFTYTISDGNGGTASALVTITVSGSNLPPVANPDAATVAEDSGVTPIDVLANDTTEPGETLTITAVTQPTGGTVVITGGGTGVSFQPDANFNGTATFSYTISDGFGGSATATVTVTVTPVNDPPTAVADTATLAEDDPATSINVLANDSIAPDTGETLTITSVTQPAGGTVVITGGGTGLTFQPAPNFNGVTTFSYTISDGNGGTASATVTVTVTPVNDPPTAVADTATIAGDAAATTINVLANDSSAPDSGEVLSVIAVTQPAKGTVVITGGGTALTYQPPVGFVGTATFTYTLSDGNGGLATASVTVTVTGVDSDGDQLSDAFEISIGTDPHDADTDDDGLIDGLEPTPGADSDGDGLIDARDPDSDNDGLYDGTEAGVTTPNADTDLTKHHFIADADPSTTTNPLDPDTDGGGLADGSEDTNHDGKIDPGERDPNLASDDAGALDTDGDGLPDAVEIAIGSNPNDPDSDDDGVVDGSEPNYQDDTDGDGLINVLDPDSDNDGLFDGTESGVTVAGPGTDVSRGHFVADADPTTQTRSLDPDTDRGGVKDGLEDTNHDGKVEPGEGDPLVAADDASILDSDGDGLPDVVELQIGTNPNDPDSDDDGVLDGAEPDFRADSDGDGLINALDPDSDNDGLFDGTELGVTVAGPGTDTTQQHFVADADPSTTTNPLDPDTDHGGVPDGSEDANHDGKVDPGERDPNNPSDDATVVPPIVDGDHDGITDGSDNCPTVANPDQADVDGDGRGDVCDVCPAVADPAQADLDGDGIGDACDPDANGDGFVDTVGVSGGGCSTSGGAGGGSIVFALALVLGMRRRRARLSVAPVVAIALVGLALAPRLAAAQVAAEPRNFSVERFQLANDRDGLLGVEWAESRGNMAFDVALWVGYANDPLVVYADMQGDRQRVGSLVSNRTAASLTASLSPRDWVTLGFELPLVLAQDRASQPMVAAMGLEALSGFGVGDLRLVPKFTLLRQRDVGIGLAILPILILPTESSQSAYLGDRGVGFAPTLALSRRWVGWRAAANLGYHARKEARILNLVVDDELTALAGVGYRFEDRGGPPVGLDLTLSSATAAAHPFQNFNANHLEALVGANMRVSSAALVFAGGGVGLRDGFGTPDWRLLLGLRVGSEDRPLARAPATDPDRDGDGIVDRLDHCPAEPEDRDGFMDSDGCPDPDNDADGVLDGVDKCPDEAGIAALAGCPDHDTDHDGIPDQLDKCPTEPEDVDGYDDGDGCPDLDNDQDGVPDATDACPVQAGPAANKGCPDTDRDGDTVPDRLDNCPDQAGDSKNAGCATKQLVTITEGKLEILESVYFQLDKAVILARSFKLLDNVASVLVGHDALVVEVQGHTDSQGNDAYNKSLSQRRAAAVVAYLVKKGVPAGRLSAMGYGEEQPIADNATKDGRAQNRRVVFKLVGGTDGTVQTHETGAGDDTKEK